MKPDLKKLVILNLPYLIFVYLFGKCGQAYRLAAGADLSGKLLHLADGFTAAFANPLPSLHLFDFCVGVAGALIVRLVVYCKGKNAKKYRKGVEYGVPSAAQPRRAFAGNAETDRLRPELAGLQSAGGGRNCTGGRRRRYDRGGICGGWL